MTKRDLPARIVEIARANPPHDRVPFAFEKRVMARLQALEKVDVWAIWSKYLWQAAAPCVAIMIAMSVWAFLDSNSSNSDVSNLDLEATLVAPLAASGEVW